MLKEIAQALGQRQHPLPHRDLRKHMVHQMRGGLRHAPGIAGRTDAPALAGVGNQKIMPAAATTGAGKAMRQDPTLQILAQVSLEDCLLPGEAQGWIQAGRRVR
jgi:hypothetical protein